MLIAESLGQTVTPAEVAVVLRERGYHPLSVTPIALSPPVYNIDPFVLSPAVSIPVMPISPYVPASVMPVSIHYEIPELPEILTRQVLETITIPASLPDVQPAPPGPLWEPVWGPVWQPDMGPSLSPPVSPLVEVVLPEIPFNIQPLSPPLPVLELPAFILEEFPMIPEQPISPPVSPEFLPELDIQPSAETGGKSVWLLLAALGIFLVTDEAQRKSRQRKKRRKEAAE